MTELPKKITDDPYGAAILIRRLITEQGAAYWRRYLLAFLLGVCATATLPPVDLTPLLLVAFPGLLWLDEGRR